MVNGSLRRISGHIQEVLTKIQARLQVLNLVGNHTSVQCCDSFSNFCTCIVTGFPPHMGGGSMKIECAGVSLHGTKFSDLP
jgi:hypothetical protein